MDRAEEKFLNYVGNLNIHKRNIYTVPWGQVILRGCDEEGDLLIFKNSKQYKDYGKELWIQLQVVMLRDQAGLYAVYACPQCDSMQGVESLSMNTALTEES